MVGYTPGVELDLSRRQYALVGATSSAIARVVAQPLDVLKIRFQVIRAVEIPCLTCPTWTHFIQDKLKISIYLSLDKCKTCRKLIKFCISYFD